MPASTPLTVQLRDAWRGSGLTLPQLVERAGLPYGADNLSRKLAGKQVLDTRDAEAIADVLGVTLTRAPQRRKRAA